MDELIQRLEELADRLERTAEDLTYGEDADAFRFWEQDLLVP